MKYRLSGFSQMIEERPTLLIPYFTCYGTNLVFAQNLSDDYLVSSFIPFAPDRYVELTYHGAPIELAVGEPGILAVHWEDGHLSCGTAAQIKPLVLQRRLDQSSTRFFAIEAAMIVGDATLLDHARYRASTQLGGQGEGWLADQKQIDLPGRASTPTASAPPDEQDIRFQDALEQMRVGARDEAVWPNVWLRTWSEFGPDTRLIDLARWWLRRDYHTKEAEAVVMLALVKSQGWGVDFAEEVINWLRDSSPYSRIWPEIWINLARSVGAPPVVETMGLQFLRRTVDGELTITPRVAGSWCVVWKRLWLGTRATTELVDLAANVPESIKYHKEFAKAVLMPLARSEFVGDWPLEVLHDWIHLTPTRGTRWARAYIELLDKYSGDLSFINYGERWLLRQTGGGLPMWPRVWRALAPFIDIETRDSLAISWLSQSDPGRNSWPDVLGEVLRSTGVPPNSPIGSKALRWVRLQKEHPDRDIIAQFAETYQRLSGA